MAILSKPKYFFQTKGFRIGLVIVGAVIVVLLVVFSKQVGQLLEFFGSKAGINQDNVILDGSSGATNFLAPGYSDDPAGSFKIVDGKLMLNDTGEQPQ